MEPEGVTENRDNLRLLYQSAGLTPEEIAELVPELALEPEPEPEPEPVGLAAPVVETVVPVSSAPRVAPAPVKAAVPDVVSVANLPPKDIAREKQISRQRYLISQQRAKLINKRPLKWFITLAFLVLLGFFFSSWFRVWIADPLPIEVPLNWETYSQHAGRAGFNTWRGVFICSLVLLPFVLVFAINRYRLLLQRSELRKLQGKQGLAATKLLPLLLVLAIAVTLAWPHLARSLAAPEGAGVVVTPTPTVVEPAPVEPVEELPINYDAVVVIANDAAPGGEARRARALLEPLGYTDVTTIDYGPQRDISGFTANSIRYRDGFKSTAIDIADQLGISESDLVLMPDDAETLISANMEGRDVLVVLISAFTAPN